MLPPATPVAGLGTRAQRSDVFEQWLDDVNRVCGTFGAEPLGEHFTGQLSDRGSGSLRVSLATLDQLTLFKDSSHLDSRERCFYAVLQLRGASVVQQSGQDTSLAAGDLTLLDGNRPFRVLVPQQSCQVSMLLPATLVEHGAPGTIACARRIDSHLSFGKWASQLVLDAAAQREQELTLAEVEALQSALVSLLRPAICPMPLAEMDNHEKLYQRACAFVHEHLRDDELLPEQIARAVGVSVRGLYRLFARRNETVSRYIRDHRLDACAQALRSSSASMTALSLEWGFTNISHFSSAFKDRFGQSPSQYRHQYRDQYRS